MERGLPRAEGTEGCGSGWQVCMYDGSEGFALVKDIRKEEGDEAKDDQDDSNGGGIR